MITPQPYTKETNIKPLSNDGASASDTLKAVKEDGANFVQHVKDDTRGLANSIVAEGQHQFEDFKSFAGGYLKTLEKDVAEKPVQSVAIAFAVGAVLSLLLWRK